MNDTSKQQESIPFGNMNRRQFLTLCALGALPGLLAACQNAKSVSPKSTATATPTPSPTKTPTPAPPDWSGLARSLHGTLVRPDSTQYQTARQLFNTRFDTIYPSAIAYCVSPTDVQTCLAFARRFSIPFAPRSGGHSYAGYSTTTGLVIDVTRMGVVTADAASQVAVVGAGAKLIDVYATLSQYGLALTAGTCATVGVAGLALGGGVGALARKFGLTCDNLLSAQIVTADGRFLTCDANHYSDLFWALRGGGGGNFGIVTSFTFRTYPVSTLSQFTLRWPWSSAASVVSAWQDWAPHAPDELWSNCLLQASWNKSSSPVIQVGGVYIGDVASLNSQLLQLTDRLAVAPLSRYVSAGSVFETMLDEAGCYSLTVPECHLPSQNPQGQLQRGASNAKSDYFSEALSSQGIDLMVNTIAQCQVSSVLGAGGIGLDAFGGAINRVASDATAYVHRNRLFSAQYSANWVPNASNSIVAANNSWLTNLWQSLRPYASGEAYQNYIDPALSDWQQAYYGANLSRLQSIKAIYDPDNLFRFGQSIVPVR